jgi:hypothetical protein
MARDQEVTAKFAVQEAQVKYDRAAAAAASNPGNSPDARRDQAALAKAKAELDAAIAKAKLSVTEARIKAETAAAAAASASEIGNELTVGMPRF